VWCKTEEELKTFLRQIRSWPSATACLCLMKTGSFGVKITVVEKTEPKQVEWWKKL